MTDNLLVERDFLTREYLASTIRLVRSMTFVTRTEGVKYNEWIRLNYPQHQLDYGDKKTWRYYKHIVGEPHPLDVPVTMISVDTGEQIELTRANMAIHTETQNELLKMGPIFSELRRRFPEQNLYILACVLPQRFTLGEVVDLPEYTLISYNDRLVEPREYNLIFDLQEWVDNFKVTRLIPYYNHADTFFHAAQLVVFSSALLLKVMGLRLKNSNTFRAHSFHIINYFASTQRLDNVYNWLSERQIVYLYRNILYLRNHIGRNHIFNTLMQRLFEDRRISVLNYTFQQRHELREDDSMASEFVRRYLTTGFGQEERSRFGIEKIREIESTTASSNALIWESEDEKIREQFDRTSFSRLLSKDLETAIIDYADNVESPLALVMVNTWAYLLKTNRATFNVKIRNIKTNKDITLGSFDGLRLFWAAMTKRFYNVGPQLFERAETFPVLHLRGIMKEPLPDDEFLMQGFYKPKYLYRGIVNEILEAVPPYQLCTSVSQFKELAEDLYLFNIGMWIYRANLSDMNDKGQMERAWWRLHDIHELDINAENETVKDMLLRTGFYDIVNYTEDELDSLILDILDVVFAGQYSQIFDISFVQQAMADVFKKLSSYSVQFVNIYTSESPTIAGLEALRFAADFEYTYDYIFRPNHITVIDQEVTSHHDVGSFHFLFNLEVEGSSTSEAHIPVVVGELVDHTYHYDDYNVNFSVGVMLDSSNQLTNAPTQERLAFLFENPL